MSTSSLPAYASPNRVLLYLTPNEYLRSFAAKARKDSRGAALVHQLTPTIPTNGNPHESELLLAEEELLRAMLNDPSGEKVRKCRGWASAGVFQHNKHAALFAALEAIIKEGKSIEGDAIAEISTRSNLPLAEVIPILLGDTVRADLSFPKNRATVHKAFLRRKRLSIALALTEAEDPGTIEKFVRVLESIARASKAGGIIDGDRFAHTRFNPDHDIAKPASILKIGNVEVGTPGNIVLIAALPKGGKTATVGATIAAMMATSSVAKGDTFSISAANPSGKAVLHVDTEQCRYDHHKVLLTAMRRAGVQTAPEWLYSYSMLGASINETWDHIDERLGALSPKHGGIFSVILDGVGDLLVNTNDPEESSAIVHKLQKLAVTYDCLIICVLHLNPSPNGQPTKSRGHLGSTLERKAEVDLRIVKDADEISTIFTACSRREPIPPSSGPRFKWSAEAGMHVTIQAKYVSKDTQKIAELRDLAGEVFAGEPKLKYTDLRDMIMAARRVAIKTAERQISNMKKHNIIQKDEAAFWSMSPVDPIRPSDGPLQECTSSDAAQATATPIPTNNGDDMATNAPAATATGNAKAETTANNADDDPYSTF